MGRKHVVGKMILLEVILILGWTASGWAGPLKAFSLREAIRRLEQGQLNDPELQTLSGITRFSGMVVVPESNDLILIGRVRPELPEVSFDDLVVALRCRVLAGKYPCVSIDMTEETERTGMQSVRFDGGIDRTQFGRSFLQSDILLKRYSLDLLDSIDGVSSYLTLYEEQVKQKLRERGHQVEEIQWLSEEDSAAMLDEYEGKTASEHEVVQSRFWFHVRDDESFVMQKDDVYLIEELRLGVKTETVVNRQDGATPRNEDEPVRDEPGEEFAAQFTEQFATASEEHPGLKRLKALFDLVCIAEGLADLGADCPDINYLLHTYRIRAIPTPEDYPLLRRVGHVRGSDGASVLVQLSGGIEMEALLLALEDGDVSLLKEAVLASRPSQTSLCWTLPLDDWAMPNDESAAPESSGGRPSLSQDKGDATDDMGFSLDIQVFTFDEQQPDRPDLKFKGFSPPQVSPPWQIPLPTIHKASKLRVTPRDSAKVAGVLLNNVATVQGDQDLNIDLLDGSFSLVLNGPRGTPLDEESYRKFITALWAVYFTDTGIGISIDPVIDPDGQWLDRHLVRYIGNVANTDLGRVMREADYLMKQWAVGTSRPAVAGFENPDDIAAKHGHTYLTSSRFWFVPEEVTFRKADDMLLFEKGHMTLKTEYLMQGLPEREFETAEENFAQFFTEHYEEIAAQNPVYQELFEYAKLVGLAQYLKDSGVPLWGPLMMNKDLVLTEDSPGTVAGLTRPSDYFRGVEIHGGVDLATPGTYVYDAETVRLIDEAMRRYSPARENAVYAENDPVKQPDQWPSFEVDGQPFTVIAQQDAAREGNTGDLAYVTDLAMSASGIQLTREAWQTLRDDLVYQQFAREWNRALESGRSALSQEELDALYRESAARAHRKATEIAVALTPMIDKAYSDKTAFHQALDDAVDGYGDFDIKPLAWRHAHYRCSLELVRFHNPDGNIEGQFGSDWHLLIPYRIEPADAARVEFLNAMVPEKMALRNLIRGECETLTFSPDRYKAAGYIPGTHESGLTVGLFLLSDASYRLQDKLGNEFSFDPAGYLTDICITETQSSHIEYLRQATAAFETIPYDLKPAGKERVRFRNTWHPKAIIVRDLVHGSMEVLTFTTERIVGGYVPLDEEASRYQILAPLSDASFRLLDKQGNEIAFTPDGNFERLMPTTEPPAVASISSGPYRIGFSYTIGPNGRVLVAAAHLSKQGDPRVLCEVRYSYNSEGKLSKAVRTGSAQPRMGQAQQKLNPVQPLVPYSVCSAALD